MEHPNRLDWRGQMTFDKAKLNELRMEATEQFTAQAFSPESIAVAPETYASYVIRGISVENHEAALRMLLEAECKRLIADAARDILRIKLRP